MDRIQAAVSKHFSGGRFVHAYIITGSDADGREKAAQYLAQAALCEGEPVPCGACRHCRKVLRGVHPDITYVQREKSEDREIKIDAARALRAQASVRPNEAERSVFIIREADTLNTASQNALLKVFEEPADFVVFILLAENTQRLLETVRSRCQEISLPPADKELPQAALAIVRPQSNLERMAAITELEKLSRSELGDVVSALPAAALREYKAGRMTDAMLLGLREKCALAEKYLAVNISASYISGLIMTAFPE